MIVVIGWSLILGLGLDFPALPWIKVFYWSDLPKYLIYLICMICLGHILKSIPFQRLQLVLLSVLSISVSALNIFSLKVGIKH